MQVLDKTLKKKKKAFCQLTICEKLLFLARLPKKT